MSEIQIIKQSDKNPTKEIKWKLMKLKFLCKVQNGSTPKSNIQEFWNESLKWFTPNDFKNIVKGSYLEEPNRYISYKGLENSGCSLIEEDSLLLTTRAPVGKVAKVSGGFTFNQGCKSLTPLGIDIGFLYYSLYNSEEFLKSLSNGTTFKELSTEGLINFKIPVPPLKDQRIISKFLDIKIQKIDVLIQKTEKKILLLKEQKNSLINRMVLRGLDTNVEMKDSGVEWIGEIPKNWKMGRFKYFINLLTDYTANGSFKSLADNVQYLDEGFSRLVRLTDLRENLLNTGIYISEEAHKFLKKSELFGNEILIANVGANTGLALKMPIHKGKCSLAPNMFLVKNNDSISEVDYLIYLLNCESIQNEFKIQITSTAQPKINKDNLKSIRVPIPPKNEQKIIANYLNEHNEKIDLIITKEAKKKSLLIEYRKSFISSVITGKIHITKDMI